MFPLLIIGIILGLIHPAVFHGAYTVSTVLIWVGIVTTVGPFLFVFLVGGTIFGIGRRLTR
jgi:hypothetical protein